MHIEINLKILDIKQKFVVNIQFINILKHQPTKQKEFFFLLAPTSFLEVANMPFIVYILKSFYHFPHSLLVHLWNLTIIIIKVALSSTTNFISKNNKHNHLTLKFHNRTTTLQLIFAIQTRCVIHNGPTINLISMIDIVL